MNTTSLYNANGETMTPAAFFSLQAALRFNSIGRDAAIRFVMNRADLNFTQALRLITLARQLIAMETAQSAAEVLLCDTSLDFMK